MGVRGSTQLSVFRLFQWFRQPKRLGKAVAVEFVLSILVRLAGIVATIPSLYLFYVSIPTPLSADAYTTLEFPDADGGNRFWWRRRCLLSGPQCLSAGAVLPVRPSRVFPWGRPSAGDCKAPRGSEGLSSGSG